MDDYVGPDNPVRFIDAFVDQLDIRGGGIHPRHAEGNGPSGYAPDDLLKL